MPDYPGGNIIGDRPSSFRRRKSGIVRQVDTLGNTHSIRLNTEGNDVSRSELDAFRQAVGEFSNAGVYFDGIEDYHSIAIEDARAFNQNPGSVNHLAIFVWEREDNPKLREYVPIGAPKADYLTAGDKPTVKLDDPKVEAIINTGTACFNASIPDGEPNYVFRYAYTDVTGTGGIGKKKRPQSIDPVGQS